MSLTLAEIRTRAQQRSDMVNTQFITDSEWTSYINEAAQEAYDLLVQKYGGHYFATTYSFTTTGTDLYALPTDFYKLVGVEVLLGSAPEGYVTLQAFNFADRNRFARAFGGVVPGYAGFRYCVVGENLMLKPVPASGQTVRIWYVPTMPMFGPIDPPDVTGIVYTTAGGFVGDPIENLANYQVTSYDDAGESLPCDTVSITTTGTTNVIRLSWDAVNGATGYKIYGRYGVSRDLIATTTATTYDDDGLIAPTAGSNPPSANTTDGDGMEGEIPDQWVELVVLDAAIKALLKEESTETAGALNSQKQAIIGRIEAATEARDASMAQTVAETSADGWPYGNNSGWGW